MELAGEQRVAAPRQRVWEALNDPEVLRAAIPGCQTLEKEGDDRFTATVEVRIGPIGARFKGGVQLADIDPGNGYTLIGEGSAGIAGSAKGAAKVRLSDAEGGTLVSYNVDSQVAGRLAQLGGPIIDATARQLAAKFFSRFGEVVSGAGMAAAGEATAGEVPEAGAATPASVAHAMPLAAPRSGLPWAWLVATILAVLVGFVLGQSGARGGILALVLILLIVTTAAGYEAGRRGGGRP